MTSAPLITLDHRSQTLACWLGKAVGGTLGMPLEGRDGPFDLSFYDPIPTEMLPNDDLDLQVVWACVLDAMEKPAVDRMILGQAWLDHVRFPWDEYGVAIRNLTNGLAPPASGSYDNWFARGMGAAIRSELWACLAPGDPKRAAAFAYEDACVDHAGEGIWAEVFLAALQSGAFIESNGDRLLDAALTHLPQTSDIHQAIQHTRQWWSESKDWKAVREKILTHHGRPDNFTDVVMNLAFTILGWLAGEDDFSKSICIAVNCGKDTDCTGATLGALLGILDPKCIGPNWLEPIGRRLVLSKQIVGLQPPATLDAFTDMVVDLSGRLAEQRLGGAQGLGVRDQGLGKETPDPDPSTLNPREKKGLGGEKGLAFRDQGLGKENLNPNPSSLNPSSDPNPSPLTPFEIAVRFGFTDRLPPDGPAPHLPDDAPRLPLGGTWARWDKRHIYGNVLLVEYPFYLDKRRTARVMFDCPLPCRIWIDQTHAFSHNGGPMCPSFHRAPAGHFRDMNLARGEHLLLAAIALDTNPAAPAPQWVVGLGDGDTHQWLPEAFLKPEHRTPESRFNTRWRET
jgi:ADP-ribosylglycohydrolase